MVVPFVELSCLWMVLPVYGWSATTNGSQHMNAHYGMCRRLHMSHVTVYAKLLHTFHVLCSGAAEHT